jgi:hypothetical protein
MIIQKRGFVLAFSLLISSIVLALAFGIFNILLKQIVLTSSAKDSQIAFYAADAGAECALYWDTHNSRPETPPFYDTEGNYRYSYRGVFALSANHPDRELDDSPYPDSEGVLLFLRLPSNFTCGSQLLDIGINESANESTTDFRVNLSPDGKICALVNVEKRFNTTQYGTIIRSRGYNDCNTTNTRRVERAIEVKY